MAMLQRILGTMLANKLGGRGGAIGTLAMMGVGGKAGLAALGYLAYRSYRENRRTGKPVRGAVAGTVGGLVDELTGGKDAKGDKGNKGDKKDGSWGDRLRDVIDPQSREPEIEDRTALLLIRAMIVAAHSDGRMAPGQRRQILSKLDEAEADEESRRLVERELDAPVSLDSLLREIDGPDTARQFYLASRVAIDENSQTHKAYLTYLQQRLKLSAEDVDAVERVAS
jgi:uncharacterized membrane protein YebE (DUF533 family)